MEQSIMEQEVLTQLTELMEKSGFESIAPVALTDADSARFIDTTLINLKTLNARYDKNEAIQQIRCLMEKYNIQLDQLMDGRGIV
jgi:hypothetical protein